jgi:hypothetical protein
VSEPTPRPWAEGEVPTAEQFTDWFLAQPRDEQLRVIERAIENGLQAMRCVEGNHHRLMHEVVLLRETQFRYRKAWLSARRRAGRRRLSGG